jgi:hypothetical protein
MMLTANDIMLVRASFARVAPIKDAAADLFYGRCSRLRRSCARCFPPICARKSRSSWR